MRQRLAALLAAAVSLAAPAACERSASDAAPAGSWRDRLRAALYERAAKDGSRWGRERLDPLLSGLTQHHLTAASHAAALTVLDALVADVDAGRAIAPLERALIQRDLWAVHDWAVEPLADRAGTIEHEAERNALRKRLAAAMARVALDDSEIARLPDTLATTAASGRHSKTWDPKEPLRAFLPSDLFDTRGPWVCLGDAKGRALAPFHHRETQDRAAFEVFVRLPGGRVETEAWIEKVAATIAPHDGKEQWPFDATRPEPPPLTQFAVARLALLVNRAGRVRASPIVERVELRVHGAGVTVPGPGGSIAGQPASFRFDLDAARLLGGEADPLVPLGPDSLEFFGFAGGNKEDGFDGSDEPRWPRPTQIMQTCVACHGAHLGAFALQSVTHSLGEIGALPAALRASTVEHEVEIDARSKEGRSDFALLHGAFSK